MLELRPGLMLASTMCETRVVVVQARVPTGVLTCGGSPMVEGQGGEQSGVVATDHAGPTLIGKRYIDAEGTVEVLCTKSGAGRLALDGALLEVKEAKPLPASD